MIWPHHVNVYNYMGYQSCADKNTSENTAITKKITIMMMIYYVAEKCTRCWKQHPGKMNILSL